MNFIELRRWHRVALIVALASAVLACAGTRLGEADAPAVQAADPAATEAALALLERMSLFLAAQPRLAFVADTSFDVLQANGELLEFGSIRQVVVRRPDRAFADSRTREGERRVFYFDGQRISFALPETMTFASEDFQGTLDQAIDHLASFDIPMPLSELLSSDLWAAIESEIDSASIVDVERVGETICDHVAFRTGAVDFELWIGREGQPLPHRLVIRYREAAGNPAYRASLEGWNLDPPTPNGRFDFAAPASAQRVPFEELANQILGGAEETP